MAGSAGGWTTGAPSPGSPLGVARKPRYERNLGGMHPRADPPEWGLCTMQLRVQTLRGRTITLDVKPSEKVRVVKAHIRDREGISVDDQRLIFAGRALQDHKCLSDYNMRTGQILQLRSLDGVKDRGHVWTDRISGAAPRRRPFEDTKDRHERVKCVEAANLLAARALSKPGSQGYPSAATLPK
eukprot:TRINITY_DN42933_c1_g1_i1.p1 TRINITY_DN42933_c1_g1~~TRINITY_DN42933_c1_g1_i1.p1  ORF type:complete len:184 (+),score=24.35 TRINITY_DN42933_c1_g1_i1:261-812(+)